MGTLLVVGLPADPICFPAILMAAGEIRIQASTVGTREDLREVLAMAAAGNVRCQVAARPLTEVNEAFEQLRGGPVSGRLVLAPSSRRLRQPTPLAHCTLTRSLPATLPPATRSP